MGYRLAIFDFDGTLADSFPWFAGQFNTLAQRFGCRHVESSEIEQLRGLHTRQIMAHVGLSPWRLPALLGHVRAAMQRDAGSIGLFEGIAVALSQLRQMGVRLAVVSSNQEATVRQILGPQSEGLFTHFSCGASMFGKQTRFRQLMRRCDCSDGEVLCIGDELRDAEAAKAANLDFGAVSWGYTRADALAPLARHVFGSPQEIPAAFL